MKPHKWAKEIKAWADGADIEMYKGLNDDIWDDAPNPNWNNSSLIYRIKPQPCVNEEEPRGCYRVRCQLGKKCVDDEMSHRLPQSKEPQYLYVYCGHGKQQIARNKEAGILCRINEKMEIIPYIGKIRLEVDDEV